MCAVARALPPPAKGLTAQVMEDRVLQSLPLASTQVEVHFNIRGQFAAFDSA